MVHRSPLLALVLVMRGRRVREWRFGLRIQISIRRFQVVAASSKTKVRKSEFFTKEWARGCRVLRHDAHMPQMRRNPVRALELSSRLCLFGSFSVLKKIEVVAFRTDHTKNRIPIRSFLSLAGF